MRVNTYYSSTCAARSNESLAYVSYFYFISLCEIFYDKYANLSMQSVVDAISCYGFFFSCVYAILLCLDLIHEVLIAHNKNNRTNNKLQRHMDYATVLFSLPKRIDLII